MTDTVDQVINRWTNAEEIRLRAGEISPATMRDILAITRAFAFEVEEAHEYEKLKAQNHSLGE